MEDFQKLYIRKMNFSQYLASQDEPDVYESMFCNESRLQSIQNPSMYQRRVEQRKQYPKNNHYQIQEEQEQEKIGATTSSPWGACNKFMERQRMNKQNYFRPNMQRDVVDRRKDIELMKARMKAQQQKQIHLYNQQVEFYNKPNHSCNWCL